MQAKHIVAMAIGSFALGAAAVQTLHAAATPPAYVIGKIIVKDQDGYKKRFSLGSAKSHSRRWWQRR
jgi:hypothetical protein